MNDIMEEIKQDWINEARVESAVNVLKTVGIKENQLIDTVVKSCNTTPEAVKAYLAKMK